MGDLQRKWWPGEYSPFWSIDYWPKGVPNEETVAAFQMALATVGFESASDGSLEAGVEKTPSTPRMES